ncbi:MAG: hypothetical protein HPZ91_09100 [Lentisphaeria bacterium]|nr:hypothetical protein [Lentisphaeria bacterium]
MKYFTFFLQKGWLLNNRDGELEYDESAPGCLTVRRGNAGMRLFCLADNIRSDGFLHGCVHGACHPQPDRPGEGAPGCGILCRFREEAPAAGGELHRESSFVCTLASSGSRWRLDASHPDRIIVDNVTAQERIVILNINNRWSLS